MLVGIVMIVLMDVDFGSSRCGTCMQCTLGAILQGPGLYKEPVPGALKFRTMHMCTP